MMKSLDADKTTAVVHKIWSDLAVFRRVYEIVVQLILMGLYVFNVYQNKNLPLFVINLALLGISFVYFVLYLITFFKKGSYERVVRNGVRRAVAYFKIVSRAFTVGLSIYTIVVFDDSFLQKCLTIVSIVALFIQILLQAFQAAFTKYSHMLLVALEMDFDEFMDNPVVRTVDRISSPQRTFFRVLNKPLRRLDDLVNGPEEDPSTPLEDQELRDEIAAMGDEVVAKNKERKAELLQAAKAESRTHLKRIFKKKPQRKRNKKPSSKAVVVKNDPTER